MKKRLYSIGLSLVILALLFSAIGCEGPVGPQGIQGIQGAAGATGPQGPQGVRGDTGEPGTGTSIVWMGTATSAPKSWRVLNYAYYNSTHRTSYIWDGNSWEILARDGATGATGASGPRGPAGPAGPAGSDAECAGLQAQIDKLEAQIDDLEKRIDALEFVPPTINGVISPSEWGEPFGTYEQIVVGVGTFYFDLYITSDSEYLYVATDYVEGSGDDAFSASKNLGLAAGLNIYIDADNSDLIDNSDITILVSDEWIYYADGSDGSAYAAGVLMNWDGDGYTEGKGIVEVAVPLSLLDASPRDTIGLLFQAFGNGFAPLWQINPDDTHCGWPETYTDFTLGR